MEKKDIVELRGVFQQFIRSFGLLEQTKTPCGFSLSLSQVFSVEQLYEKIWGDYNIFGKENTVMVHISRLRQKIEKDPKHPEYLINVRGLGYMLNHGN